VPIDLPDQQAEVVRTCPKLLQVEMAGKNRSSLLDRVAHGQEAIVSGGGKPVEQVIAHGDGVLRPNA
jgi:hypothetical protein